MEVTSCTDPLTFAQSLDRSFSPPSRKVKLFFALFEQVVFGMPFGAEIDMWSVGCILAEIYLGKPLIFGTDRITLVQSVSVLSRWGRC